MTGWFGGGTGELIGVLIALIVVNNVYVWVLDPVGVMAVFSLGLSFLTTLAIFELLFRGVAKILKVAAAPLG